MSILQLYFARFYAKLLLQLFILRRSSGIVLVIFAVAPFAGAWIEIRKSNAFSCPSSSLPSRERGLKCQCIKRCGVHEVSLPSRERGLKCTQGKGVNNLWASLPSRERGLKYPMFSTELHVTDVAPFAGAWIEILPSYGVNTIRKCRSLRGSVD